MKKLIFLALISTSIPFAALSEDKIEMKCYVKDAVGVDGLYLINAYQEQKSKLPSQLIGRSFSKGKYKNRRIEQVLECVPETELFENVIARQLDRQTLR